LEAIYTVDHLRDEDHPLDDFLDLTIHQLLKILGSDATYIMLYDAAQEKLKLQSASSDILWDEPKQRELEKWGEESLHHSTPIWYNEMQGSVFRSIMCIPLILKEKIIGVFGALNMASDRKFLSADRSLLKAIASQMDSAIYDNLESFRLRQVLGRSVDGRVMERILKNPKLELLKPERTIATILYADMR
jgi:GAF domain-containing protein